ncbi:TPA: carbon storage regulator [Legionella pneumophila]|uniref:Translational regulator CsrA n=1 Tax=Legionella waltersii TaxID=66969 RepID=A0A0W1A0K0_9GAMM|nr:carbon storage regulator [Legionella waltersii]HAU3626762.1 carbon storage regulator [Legionella pneumophila]KTD74877.1 vir region protein [Legionella waltersii]SNV11996.1 vir region protein [Legionella waltersii]HAU3646491.1 carbon storage regulator [Legionella pneumophila]HAU3652850.1 carbon storage regulator [Legionella pneumophila]
MLVLTRRVGEEILIDKGQIQIKILYVRRGHIAVGIHAPSNVDVDRKEIYLRKKANPEVVTQQEIISETN